MIHFIHVAIHFYVHTVKHNPCITHSKVHSARGILKWPYARVPTIARAGPLEVGARARSYAASHKPRDAILNEIKNLHE